MFIHLTASYRLILLWWIYQTIMPLNSKKKNIYPGQTWNITDTVEVTALQLLLYGSHFPAHVCLLLHPPPRLDGHYTPSPQNSDSVESGDKTSRVQSKHFCPPCISPVKNDPGA